MEEGNQDHEQAEHQEGQEHADHEAGQEGQEGHEGHEGQEGDQPHDDAMGSPPKEVAEGEPVLEEGHADGGGATSGQLEAAKKEKKKRERIGENELNDMFADDDFDPKKVPIPWNIRNDRKKVVAYLEEKRAEAERKRNFTKEDQISRIQKYEEADRINPLNKRFVAEEDFKGPIGTSASLAPLMSFRGEKVY
jgi:hypothetical protein